jgi:hypothetical protein
MSAVVQPTTIILEPLRVLGDVAAPGLSGDANDRATDVGQPAKLFCTTGRRLVRMDGPVGILVTTGHAPADSPHEKALQSGLVCSYRYVTAQVRTICVEW